MKFNRSNLEDTKDFIKRNYKDIIYITLIAILFALVISLFCIKVDNEKIMPDKYIKIYGFVSSNGSKRIESKDEQNVIIESEGYDWWLTYAAPNSIKELYIKQDYKDYERIYKVKYVYWDNHTMEREYDFSEILRIEYL